MQPLQTDPVSVFLTRVDLLSAELGSDMSLWLSEQEQARYMAISAPRRRAQFVAGRCWARQCLAAVAGGHWQDYALSAPLDQAPVLLQAPDHQEPQNLHFSISHSADWLACAVASTPVGVDVEDTTRQRDTQALGEWIYGDQERARVQDMPADEQRHHFFALWTLKEAWFKQLPPQAAQTAMTAVQFMTCHADEAQAVTLRSDDFALAVFPSTRSSLSLCSPQLLGLPQATWKLVLADKTPGSSHC